MENFGNSHPESLSQGHDGMSWQEDKECENELAAENKWMKQKQETQTSLYPQVSIGILENRNSINFYPKWPSLAAHLYEGVPY